jgi:DNA-binding Xre family transcriptional regulator
MAIKINLKQFIREYEAAHKRDVTWAEIREATGISESTLNRLINEKSFRVDLDVLGRLCRHFGVSQGPVPFLTYEPEAAEDNN